MGKWVLLLTFLAAMPALADDEMTGAQFATGCDYHAREEPYREFLKTSCMMYLQGFVAGATLVGSMNQSKAFCLPAAGTSLESIRLAVLLGAQRYKDSPTPGALILVSLMDSFPCPAK